MKLLLNNERFLHDNVLINNEFDRSSNISHISAIFVFTVIFDILQFKLRVTNMIFRDDHDSNNIDFMIEIKFHDFFDDIFFDDIVNVSKHRANHEMSIMMMKLVI